MTTSLIFLKRKHFITFLISLFIAWNSYGAVHVIPNTSLDTIGRFIAKTSLWSPGDTVLLASEGLYYERNTLEIRQELTIMGDPALSTKPVVYFFENGFQVHTDSISIAFENFTAIGLEPDEAAEHSMAKALLQFDVPGYAVFKHISFIDMHIKGFRQVTQFYKNQYGTYESLTIDNCVVDDISGETALDFRKASVKQITITNNSFTDIEHGFFGELYYQDLSNTPLQERYVTQNVLIDHNTFYNVVGAANKSLIQNNAGTDGSVNLVFSNNLVSTLFWNEYARPFRINSAAGTFHFTHCVFHNFNSSYNTGTYNLEQVATANNNVTTDKIFTVNPVFYNVSGIGDHELTAANSAVFTLSSTGGTVGDPRWFPSSEKTKHKIANTGINALETFIENISLWTPGDTILIGEASMYTVVDTIDIKQDIVILGDPALDTKPVIRVYDAGFVAKKDSISITFQNLRVLGVEPDDSSNKSVTDALISFNEEQEYVFNQLRFFDIEVSEFNQLTSLYKHQYGQYKALTIENCIIRNLYKGYAIEPNQSSIENTTITNNTFIGLQGGFLGQLYFHDPTNLPAQEKQIAQQVTIDHNTFYRVTGGDTSSFINNALGTDASVRLSFTNNIVSSLWEKALAKPFEINEDAGSFVFSNNAIHHFESDYTSGAYNFPNVSIQANITSEANDTAYPAFLDTTKTDGFDFTISNLRYLRYGTDGSLIGDPRWVPEAASSLHKVNATDLEAFIEDITLWTPGDTILLTDNAIYYIADTILVLQEITIMGDPQLEVKPTLLFLDDGFHILTDSINITLQGFKVSGAEGDTPAKESVAPALLSFSDPLSRDYKQIILNDIELENVGSVIEFYTPGYGHYDSVLIDNCIFRNIRGDFAFDVHNASVRKFSITNSTFMEVENGFINDLYFQDETNVPQQEAYYVQQVFIDHNTFYRVSGKDESSLIYFSSVNDNSVELTFSNNIMCSLFEKTAAKPFVINEQCGELIFTNSTFFNYEATTEGYNLEDISALPNTHVQHIDTNFPDLKDTTNYDLRLWNYLPVRIAGTDGKEIGDPRWIPETYPLSSSHIHRLENTTPNILKWFIENREIWVPGDTVMLVSEGTYYEDGTVDIHQTITIMSDTTLATKPMVHFYTNGFRTIEDSLSVTIQDIDFNGYKRNGTEKSPFILRGYTPQGSVFENIVIENCDAHGFMGGVDLNDGKHSIYDTIRINNVVWSDFNGQYCFDPNLNFTKYLHISNSTFYNIGTGFLKNPGYASDNNDNTLIAKEIVINQNTFYRVGGNNNSFLQINDPNDNSVKLLFSNNIVSTLNQQSNARPFRINQQAGDLQFVNSVMHRMDMSGSSYNFANAVALSNVTATSVTLDDPGYSNPASGEFFLASDSPLLIAGSEGGMIGDPRWAPQDVSFSEHERMAGSKNSIAVFPNPAVNYVELAADAACHVYIYSLTGEKQLSAIVQPGDRIDVSKLISGVYLVNIQQGGELKTLKLMVNK